MACSSAAYQADLSTLCVAHNLLDTGAEGTAWSPTDVSKAPHHTQSGYSPGAHQAEQGYSPSHHPGPAAEEAGYDQDQSFTYTGAAQAGEALAGPSNQADRYCHYFACHMSEHHLACLSNQHSRTHALQWCHGQLKDDVRCIWEHVQDWFMLASCILYIHQLCPCLTI